MTPASTADQPAIEAFLNRYTENAMFPLCNLARYGMQGGHPRAVRFWLRREAGQISDVATLTNEGVLMPCCPTGCWRELADVLAGQSISGIIGPAEQCRAIQARLGLQNHPASLDEDEAQFLLQLDQMILPDGPGRIVPLADAPEETLRIWMRDYEIEVLKSPPDQAGARADASYKSYSQNNSHVVLMAEDTPLAMTGFNAELPEIVQIGGVYTPARHRGKGYARRALALHLAEAKRKDVQRATLFAAAPAAIQAYQAIGFEPIGHFTLLIFDTAARLNHG